MGNMANTGLFYQELKSEKSLEIVVDMGRSHDSDDQGYGQLPEIQPASTKSPNRPLPLDLVAALQPILPHPHDNDPLSRF